MMKLNKDIQKTVDKWIEDGADPQQAYLRGVVLQRGLKKPAKI